MDFSTKYRIFNYFLVFHKPFFMSLNIGKTVKWATVAASLLLYNG